jgi:hypothetical protein
MRMNDSSSTAGSSLNVRAILMQSTPSEEWEGPIHRTT